MENVPLFDLFTPEDATAEQLLGALNEGIDPRTGEYSSALADEMGDMKYMWRTEETPLGSFEDAANWSYGDGHEQGQVIRHVESGRFFMAVGTYSSWDSSEWGDWFEAEPVQVTQTRYKAKDNG